MFFPDFIIHMHVLALLTANCKTPEQLYTSHCGPPVGQKPEEHRLRTITFVSQSSLSGHCKKRKKS